MKHLALTLVLASQAAFAQGLQKNSLQTILPSNLSVPVGTESDLGPECARLDQALRLLGRSGNEKRLREFLIASRPFKRLVGLEIQDQVLFRADLGKAYDVATSEQIRAAAEIVERNRAKAVNPELVTAAQRIELWPPSVVVADEDIKVKSDLSLVGVARRLGLDGLPVGAVLTQEGLTFAASGLDVACDLLADRISVEPKLTVRAFVAEKELEALKSAALDISDLAAGTLNRPGSVPSRIARLSYKIGKRWPELAKSLPKGADETEQALGFLGLLVNLDTAEFITRGQIEANFPEYVEVKNVPVRFEVAR